MSITDERTFLEQLDTVLSGFDLAKSDASVVVTSVTTMVHRRIKELDDKSALGGYDEEGNVITPMPTTHCPGSEVKELGGFMRCTVCNVSFGPAPRS